MIKKIFLILLATVTISQASFAQASKDQRTLTTRIADLLAELPARDAQQLEGNMLEISDLGEDGFVTLISGLKPQGEGNNALLQYAIGGYSAYVMEKGKEGDRTMSVIAYCKALNSATDKQNKQFLISQLELVGKDDAVPSLKTYLNDPQLADPAARALVKINSEASKAALANALPAATGAAQLSVIEALGLSRDKQNLPALHALAASQDQNLAKAVLSALAHIADPSSAPVLDAAAAQAGYLYDNKNALAADLFYAQMLVKDGNKSLAKQVAKQIAEKAIADNQVHTRTAALKILAETAAENPTRLLVNAMDDKNMEYRAAALKFAIPYVTPETSSLWLSKLAKAPTEVKVQLVQMLGKAGTKAALPNLTKLLKSKDQGLRLAAIEAVSVIGQEQSLDDLYKVMRKGDTTTISAVCAAVLRMKGNGIPDKIAAYLPKSKPEVQIALIDILAARAANAEIGSIYDLLNSKDPGVKQAAFSALKRTVVRNDIPHLFTLMKTQSDPQELQALQDAAIAAYQGTAHAPADVDQVFEQMSAAPADRKVWYYKILGSLGGTKALDAVTAAYYANEANRKYALEALATWEDAGSSDALIKISRESNNPEQMNLALLGYLNLLRKSSYPAEQRLLKLREAMDAAKTLEQKQLILKDLEQVKIFNALVFAGKYLDDPALQESAANTVMSIALADNSYSGTLVKDLLNKTMAALKGADSSYEREAIRKYLAEMPPQEGFTPLFNGKDLTGWKGLVADPIKRAQMDPKTLAVEQAKADAEMRDSWKVVNGELHFMAHGNNLATIKKYGDFEMLVDWKIIDDKQQKGDAGIYLRGTPQVQIWDNSRVKDGAEVGSGGLYNNKVNESKPLKVADNKLDEWNTFRILMKGDRVTVYLNGELVTDNVILENFWDKERPIFAEEQIELQAHGSPVAYRDIYIREIPRVKPYELSAAEKKAGFKVLFDGTNMHNWTGNTTDYVIENGNIAIRPKPGKGSGGNLFTKEEFSDFVFRFEFQLTPGANNGLGIRAPYEGDAAYEGMELQILDNDAPIYKDLHVYQYHGSIYGTIPAKRGYLKPVGDWNYEEVIAKGPKIKVILNGTVILDADITEARKNGAADGKPHPGLLRNSGHIGFLGHGSPVQFRNIRIKDLSVKSKASRLKADKG
jgi:HEAT repeat protein